VELDDRMQAIEAERRRVVWQDQSEIKMQQARLVIVKSLYENARALFEKTGGISHEELQKMELEVISTEGRIDQLKAQEQREKLEFQGADQERQLLHLQAPIDGVVTHIDVDTGEWSKPGESMLRLVNSATCYLTVNVPRQAARDLETGSRLSLRAEGVAKPISGRLSFVSPVADAASGLVELRVTFDNPHGQVRPGSTGRVQLSAR
jgi:RND family efflux transporter MFP subunit